MVRVGYYTPRSRIRARIPDRGDGQGGWNSGRQTNLGGADLGQTLLTWPSRIIFRRLEETG
jgi:hypothetical protein